MVSFYFLNIALKIANHYKTKLLQLQKMKFFKYIFYRKKIILFIYFLLFAHATFAFENSKVVQIVDSSITTPVGRYIYTLIDKNAKYGIAAICNGGGGATAMLIENVQIY